MHFIMWLYHDYTDLKSQLYKKNPQTGNKIKNLAATYSPAD